MRITTALIVTSLACATGSVGQTTETFAEKEAVKRKVAAALSGLRYSDEPSHREYLRQRESLTAEVHSNVDRFIQGSVDLLTRPDADAAQSTLREILVEPDFDGDIASPPSIWIAETKRGRSLIAGYRLGRGEGIDDPTSVLRAYRLVEGSIQLVGATGSDLGGYGFFTRQIPNPATGEIWIMTWGQRMGFNGRLIRARLFTYDGERFQTRWAPDDMLDAELRFSEGGFEVTYVDGKRWLDRSTGPLYIRETYVNLTSGPALQSSHYVTTR